MIGWLAAVAAGVLTLAAVQRNIQFNELEKESAELHRLASLRAGQHDAHLTALSAIAVASAGLRPDLFLDVAATISRFYPRIDEVQLVPLDLSGGAVGSEPLPPDTEAMIRATAGRSTGLPEILAHPSRKEHYLLVKRSPNSSDAIYALALGIDATQLVGSDAEFWSKDSVHARLSLPEGAGLGSAVEETPAQFAKPLESMSQPLLLETSRQTRLADLLPPTQVAVVILLVSLIYYSARALVLQRVRVRTAEHEAEMRRMEAQLTHAARVNAMGEMASGMAHELTQPLTAILAQAQAGRRLLARGDSEAVDRALADIGSQAKRASAILERLRNWSRPQRGPVEQKDLRIAMRNVEALLGSEAEKRGGLLHFDVPGCAVEVLADQVEMEQVLHNLIRNAFEALEGQAGGVVNVVASVTLGNVILEVVDNGPGIDEALRPGLFTPFMTTRENGTGLGLALCQRLVERAGGEISYQETAIGAKFRIVLPLSGQPREAAQ
ncbi:sensor histidine kinase [Pseudophaeobacter flagellatus]|uniref:sensor histidine kinase n=1 Tax=Pseudophaeobacter flagellatus TaxID=2899119 RepID=UPI001E3F2408|nr:ATP-binding protein [Pseudophaeobacter flagellatus]MCD9147591.1 ATP-binding protein [Pseudophaeobacter flagellatus]